MQKFVNVYMFIFIALNNKNDSFAISYRFMFFILHFFSTSGVATKSCRSNLVRGSRRLRNTGRHHMPGPADKVQWRENLLPWPH